MARGRAQIRICRWNMLHTSYLLLYVASVHYCHIMQNELCRYISSVVFICIDIIQLKLYYSIILLLFDLRLQLTC